MERVRKEELVLLVAFATSLQFYLIFPVGTEGLQAVRKRCVLSFLCDVLIEKSVNTRTQVAQIATAADYEQKRLMASKAMHHKVTFCPCCKNLHQDNQQLVVQLLFQLFFICSACRRD